MTIKPVCLSIALLLIGSANHARVGIEIVDPTLQALDRARMINTEQLQNFRRCLLEIGQLAPLERKRGKPLANSAGDRMTLHDLAGLEKEGKFTGEVRDRILHILIDELVEVARPHLQFLHGAKHAFEKIITAWVYGSGQEDSLLLKWSHVEYGKEEQFFRADVHDLQHLHELLMELDAFLHDLIRSSPHSYNKYNRC